MVARDIVYKIPYRRAPRLAYRLHRPSASREQRYLAYNTRYSLGTGGVHLIQPGNWRGAHDTGNSLVKTEKTYNPA